MNGVSGKTALCHMNEAPNRFKIRIDIRHALFGATFTQVGVVHALHAFRENAPGHRETASI